MIEWTQYSDGLVEMQIPKQLKKRRPGLFFKGRIERLKPKSDLMMAVQLGLPRSFVDVIRGGTLQSPPSDMSGTICSYHGRGESAIRPGGYEVKLTLTVPEARGHTHRWTIAFPVENDWVQLDIANGGGALNWEQFESICSKIIKSFKLVRPSSL